VSDRGVAGFPAGSPPLGAACEVCGASDSLGLGTCVACGTGLADALVFVERSTRRTDRRDIEAWLVEATRGVIGQDAARDVAEGRRPMVGLPAGAAVRVSTALSSRGIPVVVVPAGRAWSRAPIGLVTLLGLVLGTGTYAAIATSVPWLAGISVLFAALLGLAVHRRLVEPVWAPAAGDALALPEPAEREVRATLLGLGDGRARRLLEDLAAVSASHVTADRDRRGGEVRAGVVELLHLACAAAVDLDRLDASLAVLERQETEGGEGDLAEAIRRATVTRDAIVARLEEALAGLGRLQAASVEVPRRLDELAGELAEDARRRCQAWEEVRRLAG